MATKAFPSLRSDEVVKLSNLLIGGNIAPKDIVRNLDVPESIRKKAARENQKSLIERLLDIGGVFFCESCSRWRPVVPFGSKVMPDKCTLCRKEK
jgi:hypothetical protein